MRGQRSLVKRANKLYEATRRFIKLLQLNLWEKTFTQFCLNHLAIFLWLLMFCILAGLLANSISGRCLVQSLEKRVLNYIPGYQNFKPLAGDLPDISRNILQEILYICLDENFQGIFKIDNITVSKVIIFMVWLRTTCSASAMTIHQSVFLLKSIGKSMKEMLVEYFVEKLMYLF